MKILSCQKPGMTVGVAEQLETILQYIVWAYKRIGSYLTTSPTKTKKTRKFKKFETSKSP